MRKYGLAVIALVFLLFAAVAGLKEMWVKNAVSSDDNKKITAFLDALELAKPGDFVNIEGETFVIKEIEPLSITITLEGKDLQSRKAIHYSYTAIAELPFDQSDVIRRDEPGWEETARYFYTQ